MRCLCLIAVLILLVSACGGGSSSSGKKNNSSALPIDPSQQTSISGRITYDYVPHKSDYIGLDYANTEIKPIRAVQIEILNSNNQVIAAGSTDANGYYSLMVAKNTSVRVRVKAQLLNAQAPAWNFTVRDNTNNNSLYVMDGNLASSGSEPSVRDLHAVSGWTGAAYTQTRTAAPFAILDGIYQGVEALVAAGNIEDFPALELRWSVKNKAADGNVNLGEIGTSYFNGNAIYVLGDQNSDTDEYDTNVILHEWGHYIEHTFSRTDSFGGEHLSNQKLDMRVAMSEGFANAFSSIMLDDAIYKDSLGQGQEDGFWFDVSDLDNPVRGWYSEASVQAIIYSYYLSDQGKPAKNFGDLWVVFSSDDYIQSPSLISILSFADYAKQLHPEHTALIDDLLVNQNILAKDEFGTGETNSGGYAATLPVYKNITPNAGVVNVCSSNRFGAANKLGVSQFLQVSLMTSTYYTISVERTDSGLMNSDPDIYVYQRGAIYDVSDNVVVDNAELVSNFEAGTYIIEIMDAKNLNPDANSITSCFDVTIKSFL